MELRAKNAADGVMRRVRAARTNAIASSAGCAFVAINIREFELATCHCATTQMVNLLPIAHWPGTRQWCSTDSGPVTPVALQSASVSCVGQTPC